jgi:hypothetical protein
MFSQALARGPETSSDDQRVGPGSYKNPTTLVNHPIIEKPQYTKFTTEKRMRVSRDIGDGSVCDPKKINYAIKRVISTSKKPPLVKFGTSLRPDYGSQSATINTRFIKPSGQIGQNQAESFRRTQPRYSLSGRCKLSGDQVQAGLDTPGPEYTLPPAMGTAPTPVFGVSSRDGAAGFEDTPGPGSFKRPAAIGTQVESTMRSSSSASLTGGGRDDFGSAFTKPGSTPSSAKYKPENCRKQTSKGVPMITMGQRLADPATIGQSQSNRVGPGSYHIKTTLTPIHPTITCSWSAKMSTSKRPSMANPSATMVAPHDYDPKFKSLSTVKSSPSIGFMKGMRGDQFSASNQTPSAQRYHVEDVDMGKLSGYLRSPAASLSGRTKFGSF